MRLLGPHSQLRATAVAVRSLAISFRVSGSSSQPYRAPACTLALAMSFWERGPLFECFHFPRFTCGFEQSSISGATGDTNPSLGRSQVFGLLGLLSQIGRMGAVPKMYDIKGGRVKLFLGVI